MVQKFFTIKVGGKAPVDLFWIKLIHLLALKKKRGGVSSKNLEKKGERGTVPSCLCDLPDIS